MGAMTEFQWTEIDGVATVWVDSPPPLRAALLFRTGRADETLATCGQTHLIEHMALPPVVDPARDVGYVGLTITAFATMGSPDEVSAFYLKICNALGALPEDRLDAERKVLRAEGAAQPYEVRKSLLRNRFGAMGYGLAGMPELGVHGVEYETLREVSTQRFTRGNAVLWMSRPPPAGFRLELPPGEKQPLPPLAPVQEVYPSWFIDDMCRGIAAGATVPRVPASTVFCAIAQKRLLRILRAEQAISYAPVVIYEPLDANTAHLVLYADSDPARRRELADAFGTVVEGLKELDDSEIKEAQEETHEHWMGSMAPPQDQLELQEVNRAAVDWLQGREFKPRAQLSAEAKAVTAGDLEVFNGEIQRSVMYAMPSDSPFHPWIGENVDASSVPLVDGRRIRSLDAPIRRDVLIHGPDGVSVLWPNGWYTSVRYNQLAAAQRYEDGAVRLIGFDSSSVIFEPTLWFNGARVGREICKRVPEGLLLNLGSRPAKSIPRPTTTAWQRTFSVPIRQGPTPRLHHAPCHACGKAVRQGSLHCHHCGASGPFESIRKGRRYLSGILVALGIQLVVAALIAAFKALLTGPFAIVDGFPLVIRAAFFGLGVFALRGSVNSYRSLVVYYPFITILALLLSISSLVILDFPLLSIIPIAIVDAIVAITLHRSQSIADFMASKR
jgi:hypothetical protein